MTPTKPRVLALLGDSILDNAAYTLSAPDTTAHVRALLGSGWIVECGAIDGATIDDLHRRLDATRWPERETVAD